MTALDRFRADAAAREKKHADIEKKSGGMTSAIDRLEKHLNKEETEQIDELKKSTVFSWLKKQPVVPEKKPGMSRKDHNQRIKTHTKSWNRALDRLSGYKPTSEDVYQDSQAATQTVFDGANNPDDCTCHKKKEMSKSARIIKNLYKRKGMKESADGQSGGGIMYDQEKTNKSEVTYGKKPKTQKQEVQQSFGDNKPQAAAVLSGGKTLTGQTRDTLEIDPMMRKPSTPDGKKLDK
jgi:phage pi2 protein 07